MVGDGSRQLSALHLKVSVLAAVHVSRKNVSLEAIQKISLMENTVLKFDCVSSYLRWVHECNQCIGSLGEFNNLYRHVRKFSDKFFEYIQMSTATYDHLLEKLNDSLSRKTPISGNHIS
jgi:hypothetical protein